MREQQKKNNNKIIEEEKLDDGMEDDLDMDKDLQQMSEE
jgi:hypothetical protein